jgi:hypothetical protein
MGLGGCQVRFSRKRTTKDRKHYCLKCWEEAFSKDDTERYSIAWKPVDGGSVKAKETSIELLPDRCGLWCALHGPQTLI